ncbi:hypothetical protein H310_04250 [Aphanomyces invadans]|uniref:Uncharacterized protein n=1 Tax=Aphanomyces invadans TaxID=157072 RepID=A0A024UHF2_9STRA|nr:hypothetical protein H310_04250 [Aphanomyces invadans]ETW05297.1 hypothetical protein H310_04250 [Aphanomyces invadans]|eukprot:XP_008866735.1 hypothetical protein H310_04250 [Aphanomyces invadans]
MERLQGEVDNLTTDVARLEVRVRSCKAALPRSLHTFDPECKVVSEYFRVFAHSSRHSLQVDFLHGIMSDAMAFYSHVGLDSLIAQWTFVPLRSRGRWLAIFYLLLYRHTIEALCHSLRLVDATLVAGPDCGGRLRAALCVGENMKNP